MNHLYLPFAAVLFLWTVLTLYVFLRTPKVLLAVKILVIPVMILSAVYSYRITNMTAGLAKPVAELPQKFLFLGHSVTINSKYEKTQIDVWIRTGEITQLLSIPWSKQAEKMLDKAQEKKKRGSKGSELEMERKPQKPGKESQPESESEEDPYDSKLKLPNENLPPKAEHYST